MARCVYSLLLYILSPLILLHLWLRGKKAPAYRKRWSERFGLVPAEIKTKLKQTNTAPIMFHCASVGEVVAATPLIKQCLAQHPDHTIVVTCNTPTGSEQIKRSFADSVQHCYLPLDFPGATKRFLNQLNPQLICILETELWLNLMTQSQKQHIPVLVVNARLSEKSFQGYQKVAPFARAIMQSISLLAAHNRSDAERFVSLGLSDEKVVTTGSIKFDIKLTAEMINKANNIRQSLTNRPIWIAGSTHAGEDEQLIQVHQKVLNQFSNALLILVPRHPERFESVAQLVSDNQLTLQRRSGKSQSVQPQVLLGDTMGELGTLYGVADAAFIGGSLIERGGHNPLEAAAHNIPVLTGPHIFNFLHVYPELLQQQGCIQVATTDELAEQLINLFNNPEVAKNIAHQGAEFVANNQGAINHTLTLIEQQITTQDA